MKNNKNLNDKIDLAISRQNNYKMKDKTVDKSFANVLTRLSTELVAGLIIGTALGLFMDNLLDSKPLFLIICFFLGGIAGIYNLRRQLNGKGLKVGFFDKNGKK